MKIIIICLAITNLITGSFAIKQYLKGLKLDNQIVELTKQLEQSKAQTIEVISDYTNEIELIVDNSDSVKEEINAINNDWCVQEIDAEIKHALTCF